MSVLYEWDCETVADENNADFELGEVINHVHDATLQEVKAWADANPCEPGFKHMLVLVRDADDGRSWAYIEDGELPLYFKDSDGSYATKVPQRFHKEVRAQFSAKRGAA